MKIIYINKKLKRLSLIPNLNLLFHFNNFHWRNETSLIIEENIGFILIFNQLKLSLKQKRDICYQSSLYNITEK